MGEKCLPWVDLYTWRALISGTQHILETRIDTQAQTVFFLYRYFEPFFLHAVQPEIKNIFCMSPSGWDSLCEDSSRLIHSTALEMFRPPCEPCEPPYQAGTWTCGRTLTQD